MNFFCLKLTETILNQEKKIMMHHQLNLEATFSFGYIKQKTTSFQKQTDELLYIQVV